MKPPKPVRMFGSVRGRVQIRDLVVTVVKTKSFDREFLKSFLDEFMYRRCGGGRFILCYRGDVRTNDIPYKVLAHVSDLTDAQAFDIFQNFGRLLRRKQT